MLYAADRQIGPKAGLHAQLVRAACTLPALQASLLPQLVSLLGAYRWSDAGQAAWLASLIPDLVDAVQSTEGPTGLLVCHHMQLNSPLPLGDAGEGLVRGKRGGEAAERQLHRGPSVLLCSMFA